MLCELQVQLDNESVNGFVVDDNDLDQAVCRTAQRLDVLAGLALFHFLVTLVRIWQAWLFVLITWLCGREQHYGGP